MHNNMNVNVSGPAQPASTYKTFVLKGQVPFSTQVTEPNTKYVIKHNFDLGGESVTIPEGCLLEFDGGAISNGTLVGQSTILIYNQPLNDILTATLEGTWRHESGVKSDEEDITDINGELKLKDREPVSETNPNGGMGRIILRKDKTFAEQLTQENTIYEIRYDFELTDDVTIPANCVLDFQGGSIYGTYTITGNNTGINAELVKILNTDVTLNGTWNVSEAYPEWFGAKGDGSTDDVLAINKALIFKNVKLNDFAVYAISSYLNIENDETVIKGSKATLKALNDIPQNPATSTHKGEIITIIAKNKVNINNLVIDGSDFYAGGILDRAGSYNTYKNIVIKNSMSSMAFNIVESSYIFVVDNIVKYNKHGIQFWLCSHCIATNNIIEYVTGGIWAAMSKAINVENNQISFCKDVGVDFEGGEDCFACGNNIKNCINGGLAVFKGNVPNAENYIKNIVFMSNNVVEDVESFDIDGTTYTMAQGGIYIPNINIGNTNDIVFNNNHIKTQFTSGCLTGALDMAVTDNIKFIGNEIDSKGLCAIRRTEQLLFYNNHIKCDRFWFESPYAANIENNTFQRYSSDSEQYVVLLQTSKQMLAGRNCKFKRNIIDNDNQYSLKVDSYQARQDGVFELSENILSNKNVLDGGLSVVNGIPVFDNQRLRMKPNNQNSFTFNQSFFTPFFGNTSFIPVGFVKIIQTHNGTPYNTYELVVKKDLVVSKDGTGSGSGAFASTAAYISSINDNTVTFNNFGVYSEINMVLNSAVR